MNSLCTTPWESKKFINMVWIQDLSNFSFFCRGDVSPTQSDLCRSVSESWAKHLVSSPVIILLKKFLSASAIAIMFWQDVTRSSLCCGVKECGTKHAHNFLFPKSSFRIRRTTFLGMLKHSAIILDVIQWSFWCGIHLWFRLMGGLQAKSMMSQRNRATHKMADMHYYGNVMTTTRWRLYVTMGTLWQQQDGGYALLWKRYTSITSSVYRLNLL